MINVSLIGTGIMGFSMVRTLLKKGFPVTVYNRTRIKAEKLHEKGAKVATSVDEAIKASDIVILMLSDASAIKKLVLMPNVVKCLDGKRVIQMGTIAPDESKEIAGIVISNGGEYLEAPVMGSIPETLRSQLVIIVGGKEKTFFSCRELFNVFSKNVFYIGDIGDASMVKLSLNYLLASMTTAYAVSLSSIKERGINTELFMEVLRSTAVHAKTYDKKFTRMMEGNFSNPNFPTKHLLKDLNLFINSMEKEEGRNDLANAVLKVFECTIENGFKDSDYSAIFETISGKSP